MMEASDQVQLLTIMQMCDSGQSLKWAVAQDITSHHIYYYSPINIIDCNQQRLYMYNASTVMAVSSAGFFIATVDGVVRYKEDHIMTLFCSASHVMIVGVIDS